MVYQFSACVLYPVLVCCLAGAESYLLDKQCGVAVLPAVGSLGTCSIPSWDGSPRGHGVTGEQGSELIDCNLIVI